MYTYNITEDTIYDEIIEQEGVDPLLPKMGLTVPCSYNEYISKKSELIVDRQTAEISAGHSAHILLLICTTPPPQL